MRIEDILYKYIRKYTANFLNFDFLKDIETEATYKI